MGTLQGGHHATSPSLWGSRMIARHLTGRFLRDPTGKSTVVRSAGCARPARRTRMWHPWPVAATLIDAFDDDPVLVEPEGDSPAPPRIDAVDHWHHRPAAEPDRHLA